MRDTISLIADFKNAVSNLDFSNSDVINVLVVDGIVNKEFVEDVIAAVRGGTRTMYLILRSSSMRSSNEVSRKVVPLLGMRSVDRFKDIVKKTPKAVSTIKVYKDGWSESTGNLDKMLNDILSHVDAIRGANNKRTCMVTTI